MNEYQAVGSKWGYRYTANWQVALEGGAPHEVKDLSLAHLKSQRRETEALLGAHLCLYQIHSATLESGVLEDPAVLAELRRMREEVGCRIGLSLSGVRQGETLLRALETGVFDSVQATWNVLEQSVGPALLQAHEAGLEVIVKEAMANGRVLKHPAVLEAAGALDLAPDQLALAAVLAQPFRPMVLSGAVTAEQLASNVAALDLVRGLPAGAGAGDTPDTATPLGRALEQLLKDALADPAAYWEERGRLAWN